MTKQFRAENCHRDWEWNPRSLIGRAGSILSTAPTTSIIYTVLILFSFAVSRITLSDVKRFQNSLGWG